jgi:hypothetical protein
MTTHGLMRVGKNKLFLEFERNLFCLPGRQKQKYLKRPNHTKTWQIWQLTRKYKEKKGFTSNFAYWLILDEGFFAA